MFMLRFFKAFEEIKNKCYKVINLGRMLIRIRVSKTLGPAPKICYFGSALSVTLPCSIEILVENSVANTSADKSQDSHEDNIYNYGSKLSKSRIRITGALTFHVHQASSKYDFPGD